MNIQSFMKKNDPSPPVLAVIGDYYSEISIAVSRQLNLEYIPQISYGATAGLLSDKTRFPSFMRTVPEDEHQAKAIIKILQKHQWTWVGVVTTDSDYGRYIVQRLQQHAEDSSICFAFTSILPDALGDERLHDRITATVKSIAEHKNVQVIVSFAKPYQMMYLFNKLVKDPHGKGKVWLASDIWSESAHIVKGMTLSDIGTVFGTTLKSGDPTKLQKYLENFDVNPDRHKNNTFLYEFLMNNGNFTAADTTKALMKKIYPYAVFSIKLAVRAVADLCVNRDCKTSQRLTPLEGSVISRCSNSCAPGYRKQSADGQPVCCYECHACPQDHFSNITDSIECHQCDTERYYSSEGSDRCINKEAVFLSWKNNYNAVLMAFTTLGALLTIIVGIIFLARWNTPVVRASVGPICILLLLSLLSTFVSVILFGGKPNSWQCQARQVLFGLSFTLCVSCIMVKSFKIILAFEFDPSVKRVLKKLYKPYIIIAACLAGQVLICALWLSFKSPKTEWESLKNKQERLLHCNEVSFPAFGAMLSYIGVLAFICFGVAFKSRKLPESYNDAKFITFSMLIYFICWIIFGPVYANVTGLYLPTVEMVVILISAYGILFCQFITKCYIILFKQEANTERAFRQEVRNYSLGQIQDENFNMVSSPFSPEETQKNADVDSPVLNSLSLDQLITQSPSMSSRQSLFSVCPVSQPQLMRQQSINNKKLKRFLSLPSSLTK